VRFGQTLFGGAVAGLVVASGIAACTAKASAQCEIIRHGAGAAEAAAQASGYGLRAASAKGAPAVCSAWASGSATAYFNTLPSIAVCIAGATGGAQVDYFGYGFANGYSFAAGRAIRTSKLYPRQARAYAYAEAEGNIWQIGHATPARATAWALGTTYFVGRGAAQAAAYAVATPAMQIGGKGRAIATSQAQGACVYTAGMSGIASCTATALGDAAITRDGVRYFEGSGRAVVTASAYAGTVAITQAQTARAYATVVGYPKHQMGGKGRAIATAAGYADPVVLTTAATAEKAGASASATGRASCLYSAHPQAARLTASASGAAVVIQTRAEAKPAQATATMAGSPLRTALVSGAGAATAVARCEPTKTQYASAQANATASAQMTHLEISARGAPARAEAFAEGQARRLATGHPSPATATATASGFNQVNDLSRAPLSRTVVVVAESRLVVIPEQPRLITV